MRVGDAHCTERENYRAMIRHTTDIDLVWLMELRVAVARCGEMDLCKWWNTDGQLGSYGSKALARGFPRTHHFAQARSVFAVAAHRCGQVFNAPRSVTLWHLSDSTEEAFDATWEDWLDDAEGWRLFFERIAEINTPSVDKVLGDLGLVTHDELKAAAKLKTSAEGNSVPLAGPIADHRRRAALLALGFAKSKVGQLVVPYARQEDA
jgi:hypothetical protein